MMQHTITTTTDDGETVDVEADSIGNRYESLEFEPPDDLATEQAATLAQLGGFFEGEGCVEVGVINAKRRSLEYKIKPQVKITHAALGGFVEAEGSIQLSIVKKESSALGHKPNPRFRLQHSVHTGIKQKLERYLRLTNGNETVYDNDPQKENWQPTKSISVGSIDGIESVLTPLLPWLGHKQTQACIMLFEIIPAMRQGKHLTKRGFMEVLEMKERLDEEKPNHDYMYDREYFRELWGDSIEAQSRLTEDW